MRTGTGLAVAAALLVAPMAAFGQPAATIEARQANFKAIARAFKTLNDELKGARPSVATLRRAAAELAQASQRIPNGFPPGTGPEAGVKTEALAAIWTNRAGFAEAANRHIAAVKALEAATQSGDLERIRAATQAVGPTCKACHDSFRLKT
ncbi:c-type cytochrome [Thermaurantiacus sp.]